VRTERPASDESDASDIDHDLIRALDTLGLEASASALQIREAFKRKIGEYHPDKLAGRGAKLRRLAEEETKRIAIAYRLLKERGRA